MEFIANDRRLLPFEAFIAGEHRRGLHLIRIASYEPGSDTVRAFARFVHRESRGGGHLTYRQIEFHFE